MLAEAIQTIGAYAAGLIGAGLLFVAALHAYASWTIRHIDRVDGD